MYCEAVSLEHGDASGTIRSGLGDVELSGHRVAESRKQVRYVSELARTF